MKKIFILISLLMVSIFSVLAMGMLLGADLDRERTGQKMQTEQERIVLQSTNLTPIDSADEFKNIFVRESQELNAEQTQGKYLAGQYKLTRDIELSGTYFDDFYGTSLGQFYEDGGTDREVFVLDGGGHTIRVTAEAGQEIGALFCFIGNSTILNLNIVYATDVVMFSFAKSIDASVIQDVNVEVEGKVITSGKESGVAGFVMHVDLIRSKLDIASEIYYVNFKAKGIGDMKIPEAGNRASAVGFLGKTGDGHASVVTRLRHINVEIEQDILAYSNHYVVLATGFAENTPGTQLEDIKVLVGGNIAAHYYDETPTTVSYGTGIYSVYAGGFAHETSHAERVELSIGGSIKATKDPGYQIGDQNVVSAASGFIFDVHSTNAAWTGLYDINIYIEEDIYTESNDRSAVQAAGFIIGNKGNSTGVPVEGVNIFVGGDIRAIDNTEPPISGTVVYPEVNANGFGAIYHFTANIKKVNVEVAGDIYAEALGAGKNAFAIGFSTRNSQSLENYYIEDSSVRVGGNIHAVTTSANSISYAVGFIQYGSAYNCSVYVANDIVGDSLYRSMICGFTFQPLGNNTIRESTVFVEGDIYARGTSSTTLAAFGFAYSTQSTSDPIEITKNAVYVGGAVKTQYASNNLSDFMYSTRAGDVFEENTLLLNLDKKDTFSFLKSFVALPSDNYLVMVSGAQRAAFRLEYSAGAWQPATHTVAEARAVLGDKDYGDAFRYASVDFTDYSWVGSHRSELNTSLNGQNLRVEGLKEKSAVALAAELGGKQVVMDINGMNHVSEKLTVQVFYDRNGNDIKDADERAHPMCRSNF